MSLPNILNEIIARKREMLPEIIENYNTKYPNPIHNARSRKKNSFYNSISKPGLSIIGEIKKVSPSKGVIKEDFNHLKLAKSYENHVEALSILTEQDFFKGNLDFLYDINQYVKLPLLCKDFIINKTQIDMAHGLGASCVLLIASILNKKQLQEYICYASSLGMDVLVEVHTMWELDKVLQTDAKIIGINNRNLTNFTVDLNTTISLSKMIPKTRLVVSESGIYTGEDIEFISSRAKIDGVLVGESFMRASNIADHAKELRDGFKR